jgi:lipopolysaccharide export system protein LptA
MTLLLLCLLCLGCFTSVQAQSGSGDKPKPEEPAKDEPAQDDPPADEPDKAVEVQLKDKTEPAPGTEDAPASEEPAPVPQREEGAQREREQSKKPPANAADDTGAVRDGAGDSVQPAAGDGQVRPVDEATAPQQRPEDSASGLLSAPTNQQSGQPAGTGGTNVAEGMFGEDANIRSVPDITTLNERLGSSPEDKAAREAMIGPVEDGARVETPGFIADEEGTVPDDMAELNELFDLSEFGIDNNKLTLDMTPEEFLEHYEKDLEFESQLPTSRLPEGNVSDIISSQQAQPGIGLMDNYAWLSVPTGNVRGSTETKQFHMDGGVIIYFDEVTISGDEADIDEKNEIAILKGNVNIIDPKYTLKTDELRILFNEKKFQATGFVSFKKLTDRKKSEPDMSLGPKDRLREYFAAREFELSCSRLFYNWETREMIALDSVRMSHPVFKGSMSRIDYDDQSKEYLITGGIKLEVEQYDWIFENELAAPEDEQKLRALTDGKTEISCERLSYEEASGVAKFYSRPGGQVGFVQPKRSVKAAYIEINDATKDFYAEGSVGSKMVYSQTDGEWLFAGGLIDRESVSTDLSDAMAEALQAESLTMEYNFDRKRLEMHGEVKVSSGEKILQADELIQDETAKFFLLRDNVMVRPDADSSIYAAQVYVDTANDVFTFVGLVQGSFVSEDLAQANVDSTGDAGFQAATGAFATGAGTGAGGTNVVEGGP